MHAQEHQQEQKLQAGKRRALQSRLRSGHSVIADAATWQINRNLLRRLRAHLLTLVRRQIAQQRFQAAPEVCFCDLLPAFLQPTIELRA